MMEQKKVLEKISTYEALGLFDTFPMDSMMKFGNVMQSCGVTGFIMSDMEIKNGAWEFTFQVTMPALAKPDDDSS